MIKAMVRPEKKKLIIISCANRVGVVTLKQQETSCSMAKPIHHQKEGQEDLIDKMARAKYFTMMDLSRGYWQIQLSKDSKEKTAFVTPFELSRFVSMPFGSVDAQATCQRLVDNRLIRGAEDHATGYVDDIALYSMSWGEHVDQLRDMSMRLQQARLTVKLHKCKFGMNETEYLGHIVGNGVIKPCIDTVKMVNESPIPLTKKMSDHSLDWLDIIESL